MRLNESMREKDSFYYIIVQMCDVGSHEETGQTSHVMCVYVMRHVMGGRECVIQCDTV